MAMIGLRPVGVALQLMAMAPTVAAAETWQPFSRTATAITGQVEFAPDRITFGNGKSMPLTRIGLRSSFKSDGKSVPADLYKAEGSADPLLLQGNRLCGSKPTYIALWEDALPSGQKARTMAVFAGAAEPGGDAGACATFGYVKDAAPQMLAAKSPSTSYKAEIPARFRGVWRSVAMDPSTKQCRASDWKGIAASDEELVEIGATAFVAFESGCDVTGVKRLETPAGEGPTTLSFKCSGEGSTDNVRENWQIVRFKGDELLVVSQIGKPRIDTYLRCN